MGRPIKISKQQGEIIVDSGYNNALGLGVVGGNTGISGNQIACTVNIEGGSGAVPGFIVDQKGSRKFLVEEIATGIRGVCITATSAAVIGNMVIAVTTLAGADTVDRISSDAVITHTGQRGYASFGPVAPADIVNGINYPTFTIAPL